MTINGKVFPQHRVPIQILLQFTGRCAFFKQGCGRIENLLICRASGNINTKKRWAAPSNEIKYFLIFLYRSNSFEPVWSYFGTPPVAFFWRRTNYSIIRSLKTVFFWSTSGWEFSDALTKARHTNKLSSDDNDFHFPSCNLQRIGQNKLSQIVLWWNTQKYVEDVWYMRSACLKGCSTMRFFLFAGVFARYGRPRALFSHRSYCGQQIWKNLRKERFGRGTDQNEG